MTEEPTPLTDEKMAAQELDPYERGILDRALDRIEEGLNDEDESAVRRFKKALEQDIVETRRTAVDPRDPKSGVKATANLLYITRQDGPTVMRVIDYADERISSLLATIDAERAKVAEWQRAAEKNGEEVGIVAQERDAAESRVAERNDA